MWALALEVQALMNGVQGVSGVSAHPRPPRGVDTEAGQQCWLCWDAGVWRAPGSRGWRTLCGVPGTTVSKARGRGALVSDPPTLSGRQRPPEAQAPPPPLWGVSSLRPVSPPALPPRQAPPTLAALGALLHLPSVPRVPWGPRTPPSVRSLLWSPRSRVLAWRARRGRSGGSWPSTRAAPSECGASTAVSRPPAWAAWPSPSSLPEAYRRSQSTLGPGAVPGQQGTSCAAASPGAST